MVMRLCILVLVLFVLATGANAFPLTGGNGQVNATVLGMYTTNFSVTQPILILDVLCNDPLNEIALVDSDDKFYQHGVNDMLSFGELPDRGVARRHLIGFEGIPAQTEIKWVRITPSVGDPFSIEWTGVPEIKGTPITVKFYGFKRESRIYRDPVRQFCQDFDQQIIQFFKHNFHIQQTNECQEMQIRLSTSNSGMGLLSLSSVATSA